MPSLISYTPFETLKLCQSIAQYGDDEAAFQEIAATLNATNLIRGSTTYEEERFSPAALRDVYDELVRQESGGPPQLNGDVAAPVSRKRKLSASPQPSGKSQEDLVLSLVEKLYARFRDEAVKEIQRDEEEYIRLQEEINDLEKQPQPSASEAEIGQSQEQSRWDATSQAALGHSAQTQEGPNAGQATAQTHPPQAQTHPPSDGHPASYAVPNAQQQHMSPGPYNRNAPTASPRPQHFQPQPVPPQHGYLSGPQGHPQMLPYGPPGAHQMPPPMDYGSRKGSSSTSTPARGSPVPPHPQQYPPYQQPYHQGAHQWPHPYPPPNAYPPHMPYPNQPYYVQSPGGRQHAHFQTPHQPQYQPYPQTAPVPYHQPHGWQPSPSQSPYPQAHSAASTPVHNPQWRQPFRASGSSTPWKRKQLPPTTLRPPSPTRPERGISPVSDTEDIATSLPSTAQSTRASRTDQTSRREATPARRGRPPSVAASGRSQSVASRSSETTVAEKAGKRKPATIKTEAPSTPGPGPASTEVSATGEQRSSGRRGRPRNNTTTSKPEEGRSIATTKRKRSDPASVSPRPEVNRVTGHLNNLYPRDPSLILVSKSFTKTAQIMLNDVSSHKLAGVFAKPLSERDAPGYKDLILRPQDLKSIKTAVGRGGRAAAAAIEALEGAEDLENTPADEANELEEREGLIGNGVYLVKQSEDLVPPRGITNSAQLELELMRVFANAIMFNPLPPTERGFGRNLRLRKRGGDVASTERDDKDTDAGSDDEDADEDGEDEKEGDEEEEEEEQEDGESTSDSEESDGDADTGIIADAREMFDDVHRQVKDWRELERERQRDNGAGAGGGAAAGGEGDKAARQGSIASVVGDEGSASTPTAANSLDEGRGSLRKRRKLAE